jgi:hypothetical protein
VGAGVVSVYVDEFGPSWGKWAGGGHMIADSLDELHAMADRIGLRREWFQDKPRFPHYDVQRRRRAQAIAYGAIPKTTRELWRIATGEQA